ncbi:MAG: transposase [bacterium]
MSKNRKQYSADQKVAILRRHLIDKVPVSDLCDEYQIHPTLFYRWQTQLFENAATGFLRKNQDPQAKHHKTIEHLQQKLQRKNEVVSELMEAHLALKKELGEV